MKKIMKYPVTILFSAFIIVFTSWDLLEKDKEISELENTPLAQKPKLTISSLIKNKYSVEYEKYINDQFVLRDNWINMKSITESALGKIENNDVVYGDDRYMFDKLNAPDKERLEKNINYLGEFIQKYPDESITVGIIPNSYMVLSEKVPYGLNNINQTEYTNEIFEKIEGEKLRKIYFLDALREHKDEYIYYKTDHHWTTLGAYYGYAEYVKSLGLKPVDWESLDYMYVEDFYGTYFNRSKSFFAESDTITAYDYHEAPFESMEVNFEKKDRLYDFSKFNVRDKYGAFLWGNNALTVMKSKVNQNKTQGRTSKILVIKDSYANCMAPYLLYNFDEVHVVDLRQFNGKLSQYMGENNFDEILIMYNFKNFAEDINIPKLRY